MRKLFIVRKILALVMAVVTLTVATSNYALKEQLLQPLQEITSKYDSLTSNDEDTQYGLNDFKPPKHSFTNYDSLFNCITALLNYSPEISFLTFYSPLKTPPEVYLDIFVPPQNLA